MDAFAALYRLAREHHGVATLGMAAEVGLTARRLRARARVEEWTKIARGAWLLPGAPDTHRARAMAHLLLLGERAVVSHASAAHFHGLVVSPPPVPVLTVPADRRPNGQPGVLVHRSRTLVTRDVVQLDGFRVTSVARTLRDHSAGRSWSDVYDLVTDAEQRRLVTPDELADVRTRLVKGPGGAVFASIVDQRRSDRSDSALERDTRDVVRRAGYEPSAGPFPIRVPGGSRLYLDVAFPGIWFAIECDGYGYHRDRRSFERDRTRWRLIQQAGWTLTWVTRRRLRFDLDGVLAEVAEAHRLAVPGRPPAVPAT